MKRISVRRFVPRLTYGNVIATIALFIALGGAAVAAGLPRNSVGPNQLKRGAVTAAKIRKKAVTSGKLAPKSVTAGKLGANAVLPGNLGNGIISTSKIAAGAVIASSIKNGVITTNKLTNGGVTTAKLADNAVTGAKLAEKSVSPSKLSFETAAPGTVATLKSGQTLRGVFDVGGSAVEAGDIAKGAVSYQLPLPSVPFTEVVPAGGKSASCTGPTSTPVGGLVCVYISVGTNLAEATPGEGLTVENVTAYGFGLSAKAKEAKKPFAAIGTWVVTAP